MTTVELHQAFCFTCERCGRDTFVRAVTLSPESMADTDLADEIAEAVDEAASIGLELGGDWLMRPETVTCSHCKAVFATGDRND